MQKAPGFTNENMIHQSILSNLLNHINLSDTEVSLLTSVLKYKVIRKKEFLLQVGNVCHADFFVNKGCLKVCHSNQKGVEYIIDFATENWWVVDLDSFLNCKSSIYYIQAIEDTELVGIGRADYELLHERIPELYKFTSRRWQRGSIDMHMSITLNLSLTAKERYLHFKKKYPSLENRVPQKMIAAYLGITPEFLSMLKKRWATVFS